MGGSGRDMTMETTIITKARLKQTKVQVEWGFEIKKFEYNRKQFGEVTFKGFS